MAQLATQDPPLLSRISALNTLDAMLYSAALAAFIARLAPGGPAAEAGVLRRAVRLTAARRALGAECKGVAGGRKEAGVGLEPQGQEGGVMGGEGEGGMLAGLCAWYSLSDSVYEKLPSNGTGYVTPDTRVYGSGGTAGGGGGGGGGGESWAVGELVVAARRHAEKYDASVQYYHMLAGVRVFPPAREEMQLYDSVLGRAAAVPLSHRRSAMHSRWRQMLLEQQTQRSGGSGAGASRDGGAAAAAAAVGQAVSGMEAVEATATALRLSVARWVVHHVREGFDHLVLCVDQLDMGEREAVRQTVRDILPYGRSIDAAGNATNAGSGSGATYDVMECDLPYAAGTGYVQPPHPNDGGDDESGGASPVKTGEGRRGAYAQVAQRARWSTFLPSPTHFMTATRGTVRSVMLWAEAGMAKAGAVCAPTVPWRLGSPYGTLEPGEGERSGEGEEEGGREEEGQEGREAAWGPGGVEAGVRYGSSRTRVRRRRYADRRYAGAGMLGPGGGSLGPGGGGSGGGGGFWGQQQQQGSAGHTRVLADGPETGTGANSTQPNYLHPDQLCLPRPCTLVARSPAPCVMVRAMPLLGHTRVYDSEGEALASERGGGEAAAAASLSYRVSYKGQEGHRLEVLRLLPTAPEVLAAREADTCSRLARPRVLLPWCEG